MQAVPAAVQSQSTSVVPIHPCPPHTLVQIFWVQHGQGGVAAKVGSVSVAL